MKKLLKGRNQWQQQISWTRMVTLYLRMKPLEHEYKVMGLAPYSKEHYAKEVEKDLDDLLEFNDLNIIHKN